PVPRAIGEQQLGVDERWESPERRPHPLTAPLDGELFIVDPERAPALVREPEQQGLSIGDLRPSPPGRVQKRFEIAGIRECVTRFRGRHLTSVAPLRPGATPLQTALLFMGPARIRTW